jgi:hypothetical protein
MGYDIPTLAALNAAAGRRLSPLLVAAALGGHHVHLTIEREGAGFVLVAHEVAGEALVGEYRFEIAWSNVSEHIKLTILHLRVEQTLEALRLWRRGAARLPSLPLKGLARNA